MPLATKKVEFMLVEIVLPLGMVLWVRQIVRAGV